MLKKGLLALVVIVLAIVALTLLMNQREAQKEFSESGRAKAVLEGGDLWKHHEVSKAGFSVKDPGTDSLELRIESEEVLGLEGTMGFNQETAEKNIEALRIDEYGEDVDWPLANSKKVRNIKGVNAQQFMVLSRFEVCNVTFERKLYFFNRDQQVVLTFSGPKAEIIAENPDFFTTDEVNCFDEEIWDFEKQADFYTMLKNREGPELTQSWFDGFEDIIQTIEFQAEVKEISGLLGRVRGRWTSTEDENYEIEFTDDYKTDFYAGEEVGGSGYVKLYDSFPVDENSVENKEGPYMLVGDGIEILEYEILELSDNLFRIIYLQRGNILEFQR